MTTLCPAWRVKKQQLAYIQGEMSVRRSDLICTACTFPVMQHLAEETWQLCLSVDDDLMSTFAS
jgi:hypothetical protein